MNEILFYGSDLKNQIDNCNDIKKLIGWYGLISSASTEKPNSRFWAEALGLTENKLLEKDKALKYWIKKFKGNEKACDKSTLISIFYAMDEGDREMKEDDQ